MLGAVTSILVDVGFPKFQTHRTILHTFWLPWSKYGKELYHLRSLQQLKQSLSLKGTILFHVQWTHSKQFYTEAMFLCLLNSGWKQRVVSNGHCANRRMRNINNCCHPTYMTPPPSCSQNVEFFGMTLHRWEIFWAWWRHKQVLENEMDTLFAKEASKKCFS